jgi:hypothetical protein
MNGPADGSTPRDPARRKGGTLWTPSEYSNPPAPATTTRTRAPRLHRWLDNALGQLVVDPEAGEESEEYAPYPCR